MNVAIVLAGGKGTRMEGADRPKQFTEVCGKPIIVHTLESFNSHSEIHAIVVVCLKEWQENIKSLIEKYNIHKIKWIVEGGATRQESVYNGLKVLEKEIEAEDVVLIHDGARPLVSHGIITDNILGAREFGAVNTVIPSTDTVLKSGDGRIISEVPARKELFMVQTPQSFKYSIIYKAHNFARTNTVEDATDDCQLVFNLGREVHLVQGHRQNIKVTTKEDLVILKAFIEMRDL